MNEKMSEKEAARIFASMGGKARAKKLTKKQRVEHAKKMVAAREAKRQKELPTKQ
jgi:hypothetical protein